MVLIGGAVVFFVADKAMEWYLGSIGSRAPASVVNIVLLGAMAAHPRTGAILERALGPAAACLRAGLPLFLVYPIVAPVAADRPSGESLVKLAGLLTLTGLSTVALTGHLYNRLAPNAYPKLAVNPSQGFESARLRAVQFLTSKSNAKCVGLIGILMSAAMASPILSHLAPSTTGQAVVMAPAYLGLTTATYIMAPRMTPPALSRVCPPTVVAGGGMLLLTAFISYLRSRLDCCEHTWSDEVRTYLAGAGKCWIALITPAISTLGLFTHSHRAIIVHQWRPLLITSACVAPFGFFFTALVGRRLLGLSPTDVASVLPATTTTGLALTMPAALPAAKEEWVPISTIFCGVAGMSLWPFILRATALRTASPLAQGFALGSASHVSVVAALTQANNLVAADAACLAFFLIGVGRCLLLQIPGFVDLLDLDVEGIPHSCE